MRLRDTPSEYGLSELETRRALEAAAYRKRIRGWIAAFKSNGYSSTQRERDVTASVGAAMLLAGANASDDVRHLHKILRTAMERITAAAIIDLPQQEEA